MKKMSTRIICICGSRGYPDVTRVERAVDQLFDKHPDWVVLTGGCPDSPDAWAHERASLLGMATLRAEISDIRWEAKGRAAGPIRNSLQADLATDVLAFWDGRSGGTLDMMTKAHARGLEVWVALPEQHLRRWTPEHVRRR